MNDWRRIEYSSLVRIAWASLDAKRSLDHVKSFVSESLDHSHSVLIVRVPNRLAEDQCQESALDKFLLRDIISALSMVSPGRQRSKRTKVSLHASGNGTHSSLLCCIEQCGARQHLVTILRGRWIGIDVAAQSRAGKKKLNIFFSLWLQIVVDYKRQRSCDWACDLHLRVMQLNPESGCNYFQGKIWLFEFSIISIWNRLNGH